MGARHSSRPRASRKHQNRRQRGSPEFFNGLLGLPVAIAGAWQVGFNVYRFGHPLEFGYPAGGFSRAWAEGIGVLLLGPARSPLYFFPAVLLLPFALGTILYRKPGMAVGLLGVFAPYLLAMPKWWCGWGGPDLGARFLLPLVPVVLVSLALGISLAGRSCRRLLVVGLVCTAIFGGVHQFRSAYTDGRELYRTSSETAALELPSSESLTPSAAPPIDMVRDRPHDLLMGRSIVARTQKVLLAENPKPPLLPMPLAPIGRCAVGVFILAAALAGAYAGERIAADRGTASAASA